MQQWIASAACSCMGMAAGRIDQLCSARRSIRSYTTVQMAGRPAMARWTHCSNHATLAGLSQSDSNTRESLLPRNGTVERWVVMHGHSGPWRPARRSIRWYTTVQMAGQAGPVDSTVAVGVIFRNTHSRSSFKTCVSAIDAASHARTSTYVVPLMHASRDENGKISPYPSLNVQHPIPYPYPST